MDDRIIDDIMNNVLLPQGRCPENFMMISQLEVCQVGGVKKRGTWRTFRVPDQRLGGEKTKYIPKRSSEYSRVIPEIL